MQIKHPCIPHILELSYYSKGTFQKEDEVSFRETEVKVPPSTTIYSSKNSPAIASKYLWKKKNIEKQKAPGPNFWRSEGSVQKSIFMLWPHDPTDVTEHIQMGLP